jgi:heme a synthase
VTGPDKTSVTGPDKTSVTGPDKTSVTGPGMTSVTGANMTKLSGTGARAGLYHGCVPEDTAAQHYRRGWRWLAALLHLTPDVMRRAALACLIANVGIVATGAAVRLSASGLGCPDWPQCTHSSLVAAHTRGDPMIHTWIEFGNRVLGFAVMATAVAVLAAAWRLRTPAGQRRRDLILLAALQPLGVLAQAAIGGVVVLTKLDPVWVTAHFLLSAAVVAAAVILYVRSAGGTGPGRWLVRPELRLLAVGTVAVTLAMLTAGTVVTGSGPLAGAAGVPRYHLPRVGVTMFHADIGWLLGGAVFALALGLRLTGAPRRVTRLGYLLLGLVAAQGVLGYLQYFTGLPAGLVWVHESSSMVIWVVVLLLTFALRDRGPAAPPAPAPAGAAAQAPAATPAR